MSGLNLQWLFPCLQGALLGLLAMVLHEVGHVVAAIALGIRVRGVGLCWKGLYTVREAGPPVKNILISSAGPLINLLLFLLWHHSPTFSLANLCCGVCNLLPMHNSDGERIFRCLRQMRGEGLTAQ